VLISHATVIVKLGFQLVRLPIVTPLLLQVRAITGAAHKMPTSAGMEAKIFKALCRGLDWPGLFLAVAAKEVEVSGMTWTGSCLCAVVGGCAGQFPAASFWANNASICDRTELSKTCDASSSASTSCRIVGRVFLVNHDFPDQQIRGSPLLVPTGDHALGG